MSRKYKRREKPVVDVVEVLPDEPPAKRTVRKEVVTYHPRKGYITTIEEVESK